MKTEQEFVTSLEAAMEMSDDEHFQAKEALMQMIAGNPILALHRGVQLAETVLARLRVLINERKKEITNAPD